jgi:hypothetical protein
VIAGRQGWLTSAQSSVVSDHIRRIDETFMLVLPEPVETESESEACLPF